MVRPTSATISGARPSEGSSSSRTLGFPSARDRSPASAVRRRKACRNLRVALAQSWKQLVDPFDIPGLRCRGRALPRTIRFFSNRQRWKDATSLRHEADSEMRDPFGTETRDGFAKQPDFTGPGCQETDNGGNAGGLSRAIAAQQRQYPAWPQRKADAMQDMAVAIECMDIGQAECVRRQDIPRGFVRPRSRHPGRRRR